MRDISIQSQAIYKTLANEVTGHPDGVNNSGLKSEACKVDRQI